MPGSCDILLTKIGVGRINVGGAFDVKIQKEEDSVSHVTISKINKTAASILALFMLMVMLCSSFFIATEIIKKCGIPIKILLGEVIHKNGI